MTTSSWRFFQRSVLLLLLQFPAVFAVAQSASGSAAVDSQWRELLSRRRPPAMLAPPRENATLQEREKYGRDMQAYFTATADAAKKLRDENPDYREASKAKLIEAENLLKAMLSGDRTLQGRANLLVKEIESDKSLPSRDRFKIVALAEHVLLRELAPQREGMQVARADSARFLMREFPEEEGGYVALLAAVRQSDDAQQIKAVAAEINESKAPFSAKAQARILAGRYELQGKSLADVANTALGRDNFFEQFRKGRTLLYTWSAAVPSSVIRAKKLLEQVPSDTAVLGYNLDNDVTVAKAVAEAEHLPGVQYYSGGGIGSKLALLLHLDSPHLVYLTDDGGVIRSVSGDPKSVRFEKGTHE